MKDVQAISGAAVGCHACYWTGLIRSDVRLPCALALHAMCTLLPTLQTCTRQRLAFFVNSLTTRSTVLATPSPSSTCIIFCRKDVPSSSRGTSSRQRRNSQHLLLLRS